MKARSKIFSSISTAVFIGIAYAIAWACGPSLEPDATRLGLFRPDIASPLSLEPFYYTERFLNSDMPDPADSDRKRNCEEWRAFTENKAEIKDIFTIQYETVPDSFLKAYTSKKWDPYANNSFVQWLLKKGNKDALQYMVLAKKTEQGQNFSAPWDDTYVKPYRFDSLAQIALKEAESKLPEFLKQRYAFQAVKLWYYADKDSNTNKNLINTYDRFLKNKPTLVAAWGALYYGMRHGNTIERTRYLLYAFDKSEEKKVFVYKNLPVKDIRSFEAINTDTALLPVMYAMKALKNPGRALSEIQDVYRYAPGSRYLPLLIGREINKLEDWILSPEVLGFSSALKENSYYRLAQETSDTTSFREYAQKNWAKDRAYVSEVHRFLQTMLETGYAEKNFIRLAIAHLYHIQANYAEARSYLNDVYAPMTDTAWQIQLETERMISLIYLNDINDESVKEQIYSGIRRMEQYGLNTKANDGDGIDERRDDLSELLMVLSRAYRQKGDIVTAGLIYQKSDALANEYDGYDMGDGSFSYNQISYFDRYATPATIDSLLAFRAKENKNLFELYIVPEQWAAEEFYLDLKGTILVREKKYKEALEVFNTMPEDFWAENYEFKNYLPANTILNAGTLLPVESGPQEKYSYPSKKLIVQDIIKAQRALESAKEPSKKANAYFQLGNALYNISFYGKAWMVYSYGNSQHELYNYKEDRRNYDWAFYNFYPNSIRYGSSYYKLSDAMDMYYRAYNYAGSNKELGAKSLLMLAYCDHLVNKDPYAEHKYYSKYLQQLRGHYGATKTFNASKTSCPDVNAFVNGQ